MCVTNRCILIIIIIIEIWWCFIQFEWIMDYSNFAGKCVKNAQNCTHFDHWPLHYISIGLPTMHYIFISCHVFWWKGFTPEMHLGFNNVLVQLQARNALLQLDWVRGHILHIPRSLVLAAQFDMCCPFNNLPQGCYLPSIVPWPPGPTKLGPSCDQWYLYSLREG